MSDTVDFDIFLDHSSRPFPPLIHNPTTATSDSPTHSHSDSQAQPDSRQHQNGNLMHRHVDINTNDHTVIKRGRVNERDDELLTSNSETEHNNVKKDNNLSYISLQRPTHTQTHHQPPASAITSTPTPSSGSSSSASKSKALTVSAKHSASQKPSSSSLCSSCHLVAGKYKCPKCSRLSCSLQCINQHKQLYSCTGKRERSVYQPLSQFTENMIVRDYALLQEIEHTIDGIHRNRVLKKINQNHHQNHNKQHNVRINNAVTLTDTHTDTNPQADGASNDSNHTHTNPLPSGFSTSYSLYSPRYRLLMNVAKQHNIYLMMLPDGMRLHQRNTSIASVKASTIQWRVEFMFYNHQLQRDKIIVQNKVNDTMTWKHVLQSILHVPSPATQSDTPTPTHTHTHTLTDTNPIQTPTSAVDIDIVSMVNNNSDDVDKDVVQNNKNSHRSRAAGASSSLHKVTMNPIVRHELRDYINIDINTLALYISMPLQSANAKCYYQLSLDDTIRQSLYHKYVIEFPIVHVVLPSQRHIYNTTPVIHRDCEPTLLDTSTVSASDSSSSSSSDDSDSDSDDDTQEDASSLKEEEEQ